jgi:hypothetical protein
MRYRPILALAATAAVAAAIPAHAAGTKTLDGKKVKALTFSLASSPQDNDDALIGDGVHEASSTPTPFDRPNYAHCPKTRCLTYSFRYKPAKGVKPGPFSVKVSWTIPGQDYDLYVYQGSGNVGQCAASAGTSETVVIPAVKGKTYTVVIDEFRAAPDTVTGIVSFPAKDQVSNTVPGVPGELVNCGL